MDVFDHILSDLRRRLQPLSIRQRLLGAGIAASLLCGLALLLSTNGTPELVPLSLGNRVTDAEVSAAETTLRKKGLMDFRREGRELLVPGDQVDAYQGALLLNGRIADDLESRWSQQLEQTSLFATRTHLQEMKDSYLSEELARMIQAIPEIEQARVRWARESVASGFRRQTRRKATVFVRLRPKTALTDRLVHGLRHGVANAVADLDPAQVTIFDLAAGRAYTAEDDGTVLDERALRLLDSYSDSLRNRIATQLAHIPGAVVRVYVKLADPGSALGAISSSVNSRERTRTFAESDSSPDSSPADVEFGAVAAAAATRRSTFHRGQWETLARLTDAEQDIHVSIGVPQEYYAAAVREDGGDPADTHQLVCTRQRIDAMLKRDIVRVLSTSNRGGERPTPRNAHVLISAVAGQHSPETVSQGTAHLMKPAFAGAGLVLITSLAFWSVRRRRFRLGLSGGDGLCVRPPAHTASHPRQPDADRPRTELPSGAAVQSHAQRDPQTTADILAGWINAGPE